MGPVILARRWIAHQQRLLEVLLPRKAWCDVRNGSKAAILAFAVSGHPGRRPRAIHGPGGDLGARALEIGNDGVAVCPDPPADTTGVAAISDLELDGRAVRDSVDGRRVTLLDDKVSRAAETAMPGLGLME